jgi:hypothetical protein
MRHPFRTVCGLRPLGTFHFLNAVGGLSIMLLLNPIFWVISMVYVGLFTVDLHENGYSLEKTLGVEQSLAESGQMDRVVGRGLAIPHHRRWAWPMVYTARPETLPDDASWLRKVWTAIGEDWRPSWREAMTVDGGFHFWNRVSQVFFLCTAALVAGNLFFVLMHVIACLRARMPRLIPFALFMPLYWVLISVGAWKGFFQLFRRPFYWEKTRHGLDQIDAGTQKC